MSTLISADRLRQQPPHVWQGKCVRRYYPQAGWTEHDPNEILQSALNCSELAMKKAGAKKDDIAGIGS